MKVLKLFSYLLYLAPIILIPTWVFYETGKMIKLNDAIYSIQHLHSVDWAEVVYKYYFPTLMTISLYCNVITIKLLTIFKQWVSSGKIRIGGSADSD